MSRQTKTKPSPSTFRPGEKLLSWSAQNYHVYERGAIWYSVMAFLIFGTALWAYLFTPWGWLSAAAILLAASTYFFMESKGTKEHQITLYQAGVQLDKDFFSWNTFEGYWFLCDPFINVLQLQKQNKYRDDKVSLHLNDLSRDDLTKALSKTPLPFLKERQESLTDLWVRALKL